MPHVGLVLGYLFNVGNLTEVAQRLGLKSRFSLILDSYAPDEYGKEFDCEIFLDLLAAILTHVGSDRVTITTQDGQTHQFSSMEELANYYHGVPAGRREPFLSAQASMRDTVRCSIQTEFWNHIGGPMPYSDQYVFAFYASAFDRDELQKLTLIRKYLAPPPAESPTGARPQGRHPSAPPEGRWNTFHLHDAEGEASCSALHLVWGFPVGRQLVCRRTPSAGAQLPPYAPLGARRGGTPSDVR